MTDTSNYTSSSDYIPHPGSPPGRPSRSSKKVHNFGKRSNSIKRNLNAPVVRSGWLYKQDSAGMKLWKKRWFVLSDMCLFYYRDEKEEAVLGSILLPSFRISMLSVEDHISKKYAFKATHPNMRTYYFCADMARDMEAWMKAMTDAALVHIEPIKRQKLEQCVLQEMNSTLCRRARSQPEVHSKDGSWESGGQCAQEKRQAGGERDGDGRPPQKDRAEREKPRAKARGARLQPSQAAAIVAAVMSCSHPGGGAPPQPPGQDKPPQPPGQDKPPQPPGQDKPPQVNGQGDCSLAEVGGAPPIPASTCAMPQTDSSHSQAAPLRDPAHSQPPPHIDLAHSQPPPLIDPAQSQSPPQRELDQSQPPPQQEWEQSQPPPQRESNQSQPLPHIDPAQYQPPPQGESDQSQPLPQRDSAQSQPPLQTDAVQSMTHLQKESAQFVPPPQPDSAQSQPPPHQDPAYLDPPLQRDFAQSQPPPLTDSAQFMPPPQKDSTQSVPPPQVGSVQNLPPPHREFTQSQPPLHSALSQAAQPREISYSQTLPKKVSSHSHPAPQIDPAHFQAFPQIDSAPSQAPPQRDPSYSQTLPRRESTHSKAPAQRNLAHSQAPPQRDSVHSQPPPQIGSTHSQAPLQESEKNLQRTSSMQQLEQWVRIQRGRIQEDDTDSVASYLTLPRKMPSQRSQGAPRYPEGYRTLPRNSMMRPDSICSLAPSLYDRALGPPASSADKRRSMRDDTMWQLYEWRLRQTCTKHGPPARGSYSTLPNPRSLVRPSDRATPSIPLSPSHGSLAHGQAYPAFASYGGDAPALAPRPHPGVMTMDRRHRTHVTQYVYPPDRRNLSSGVQLQSASTHSLQGKTTVPEEYRDGSFIYRQGNLDLDVKLSRLCEQDKVVRTQEHKLQQLYREKHTLETALLSASQEIEMSAGDQVALQGVVQQRDLLQSGLLSTCRELGRVNSALERSWREFAQLESDVTLIRNNLLEQLEALGTPQTEPPSQQHVQIQKELWRIQDVTEALSKSRTQRVTETPGFVGTKAAPNQQKSEAPDYRLCKSEPELTTVTEVEESNTEDKMEAAVEKEPSAAKGLPYPVGVVSPRTKSPLMESSSITSYLTLRKGRKPAPRTDRPHSAVEQASQVEAGRPRMSVEEQLERIRRHQEGTLRGRKKPPAAAGTAAADSFRTLQSRKRGEGAPSDIQELLASLRGRDPAKQKNPEQEAEKDLEQEPEKDQEQEPGKNLEQEPEKDREQEPEKDREQEPEKDWEQEPEKNPEQEPGKNQEQEPVKELEKDQKAEEEQEQKEKEPEQNQEPGTGHEQEAEKEQEVEKEQDPQQIVEQKLESRKEGAPEQMKEQGQGQESEQGQGPVGEQELDREQGTEEEPAEEQGLVKERKNAQAEEHEQNPVDNHKPEKEQKREEEPIEEQEQKPLKEVELVKEQEREERPVEEPAPLEERELGELQEPTQAYERKQESVKGEEQLKEQKPKKVLEEEPKNEPEKEPAREQAEEQKRKPAQEKLAQEQLDVNRQDQVKGAAKEQRDALGKEEQEGDVLQKGHGGDVEKKEREQVEEQGILTEDADAEPPQAPVPAQEQRLEPKLPEVLLQEEDGIKALVVRNSMQRVVQVVNSNPETKMEEVTEQDQDQLINNLKSLPALPLCPTPPSTPPQLAEGSHFMCV